ncbi:hypothetical protein [Amycolatopsis sp. NBC_01480]|uniref:hypothetical protein n=1 Tax=Amycolatopsis sp. NBC_01480 TaxID=2903562 RepID=UPI002E290C97|nr:hypothetical protein [Amycolatopsis sp. NBC_01480]
MTNQNGAQDENQKDVVPHHASPTSAGTDETHTEFITIREFTPYFIKRGLTLIEAVALWDELEGGDITACGAARPVIRVHCGVTYELIFERSPTSNDEAVVAITVRNADDRPR